MSGVRGSLGAVIPGRAKPGPGIHNHRPEFLSRLPNYIVPWLWIPGSLASRAPRNDEWREWRAQTN
jgi:hypothetical protein